MFKVIKDNEEMMYNFQVGITTKIAKLWCFLVPKMVVIFAHDYAQQIAAFLCGKYSQNSCMVAQERGDAAAREIG